MRLLRSLSNRFFAVSVWAAAVLASPVQAQTIVPSAPQIAASSYVLMEASSGRVLLGSNEHQPLPPASLTKLMTAYVAEFELTRGRIKPDDMVNVSVKAWKTGGSRMFLREGTQVSVMDLMRGIVIQSGNDASVAMAEHIAGSEGAFADLMNQHAKQLGMNNSHFVNSDGLPADNHLSSAYDMALLAQAIINKFPEHYTIYSEKEFTYNNIRQPNRNLLLYRDPTVDGLKTGYTEAAGYCLVASSKRDDMRLIAVVFGTKSPEARAQEVSKLFAYGFRYFETQTLYAAGQPLEQLRVWGGDVDQVAIGLNEPLTVLIPRGQAANLQATMEVTSSLDTPIEAGQQLGVVRVKLGEETIRELPLVALNAVAEGGFFKRASDAVLRRVQSWF